MFNIKNKHHHLKLFIFFILIFLSLLFFFENSLYNYLIFIIISNFVYYVIDKKNIINFFFITIILSSIICIYLINQNKNKIIESYSDVDSLCNEISNISEDKYNKAVHDTTRQLQIDAGKNGRKKNNALIARYITNLNRRYLEHQSPDTNNLLNKFQRDNYSTYIEALNKLREIFNKFGDVKNVDHRNERLKTWSNRYCKKRNNHLAAYVDRQRDNRIKELKKIERKN
tara:strand:- start:3294 stop:3977 length:684 start_codon:yes stop_codon:yes gene_type:complete